MAVVARQQHDLALLHRDLRWTSVLDHIEDDVSPQLVKELLIWVVVIISPLVRTPDHLDDQVLGRREDQLVADRGLEEMGVLVDPARKVECFERHGPHSSGAPKGLAGGSSKSHEAP